MLFPIGTNLANVLWKNSIGLLKDHFGQCVVEGLSWDQGPTLASVPWSKVGLFRDHFGQCAVEELNCNLIGIPPKR